MTISRTFGAVRHFLCRIGLHWHRERKTYPHAVGLADYRCLLCNREWTEYPW